MDPFPSRTMTATVPAVDYDNVPIIDVGDELTICTSNTLDTRDLKTGEWVIVRNPGIRNGRYLVRQYWPLEEGALLVAANPSVVAHRVTEHDAIDGIVVKIRKTCPEHALAN